MELSDAQRERWVVGALLHDSKVDSVEAGQKMLDAVGLTPAEFSDSRMGRAFGAVEVLLRQGRPATASEVAEILMPGNPRAAMEALRDLRAQAVPNADLLAAHASKLRHLAGLRRTHAYLSSAAEGITPKSDANRLASDLATFAAGLGVATSGYRLASEDVARIIEQQEAVNLGTRTPVVPTGIELLDEHITGFRNTLSLIAGAPGVGKTALMATVIENVSNAFARRRAEQLRAAGQTEGPTYGGDRVGLMALEDGTEAITSRLVAKHSGLAWGAIGAIRLTDYQLEQFQLGCAEAHTVMDRVQKFETEDGGSITASKVVGIARDWILHRRVKILFIDHLGEIAHETSERERHDLRIKAMAQELRSIAIRFSVPIVLLHHLNREAQKTTTGRPSLHHLAESEYLGRICRLALGLWPGTEEDTVHLSILKQSRGATGAAVGRTLVLKRRKEAAMVSNLGGTVVDLEGNNGR